MPERHARETFPTASAVSAKLRECFVLPVQAKRFTLAANDQSDQGKKEEPNTSISSLNFCCIEMEKALTPETRK